jgi:hypothetical protein
MDLAVDEGFHRRVDDAVLVIFTLVAESIGWATAWSTTCSLPRH